MKSLRPHLSSRIGPALAVLGLIAAIAAAAPSRQPRAEAAAAHDAPSPSLHQPVSSAAR